LKNQRVESAFRATRIKMWRITEHQNEINNNRFLFQFEYLIAKDTFEWITFITNQSAHSMNKSTSNGNIDQMDVSLNANKMLSNAKDSISNQSASNSYESLTDLFNTISNELPAHENRVFNITDDDL
uniref:SNX17_FERM_C domain-containing protein n=1 Tax=Anisakis simplex TaxID=6269 RepID=A0A0M3KJW6_ANISI